MSLRKGLRVMLRAKELGLAKCPPMIKVRPESRLGVQAGKTRRTS